MVSTDHPLATAAGLDALKRGGSATDAYISAALVQAVLMPPMTSIAGGLGLNWFDSKTGKTTMVAGDFKTPANEPGDWDEAGADSGRTVCAPGWLNGCSAAWRRWGRLKWPELFEHAIAHARDGFEVFPKLAGWMSANRLWMARYPEGQRVWCPDGRMISSGERLVQTDLARTLQRLQSDPDLHWFYTGDFAERYVAAARRDGGQLTMEDMARHRGNAVVQNAVPVGTYRGYEVHAPGATLVALALALAERGDLRALGAPLANPETVYRQMRILEEIWHTGLDRGVALGATNITAETVEPPSEALIEALWRRVVEEPSRPYDPLTPGTNALTVMDGDGNVAYNAHSCTGRPFGTGLLVDGVVLCRPLRNWGQPVRTPLGMSNCLLLARGGQAQYAVSSPSAGHLVAILQEAMNFGEFELGPSESVWNPRFGAPLPASRRAMIEGNFPEEHYDHLRKRGMGFFRVMPMESEMGSCQIVYRTGSGIGGVADPRRPGQAAGC
jgi:gamma-glutamyltranspeptidase/glutathione hydrolase